jgi:hypothetical protein
LVTAGSSEKVTHANYGRIKTGMTLEEVDAILGPYSRPDSSSEFKEEADASFEWREGPAPFLAVRFCILHVYIGFKNGKVTRKREWNECL